MALRKSFLVRHRISRIRRSNPLFFILFCSYGRWFSFCCLNLMDLFGWCQLSAAGTGHRAHHCGQDDKQRQSPSRSHIVTPIGQSDAPYMNMGSLRADLNTLSGNRTRVILLSLRW